MPIRHGDSFEKNGSICLRCSFFTSTVAPFSSTPCAWKTLFARSSPIVAILIVNAPLSVRVTDSQHSGCGPVQGRPHRSEEHTSELQSLMRISYAVFCLKKKI